MDSKVVYISYPSDLRPPPSWISPLISTEDSPFKFYFSGGTIHPSLLPILVSRSSDKSTAQKIAMKLAQGYTTRLVDSILSSDIENIQKLTTSSPQSTEYRILQDLWILSRSDVFVVDCDLAGYARGGMETSYAQGCLQTIGVSDCAIIDPWYQYHLDMIVKSPLVRSTLNLLHRSTG